MLFRTHSCLKLFCFVEEKPYLLQTRYFLLFLTGKTCCLFLKGTVFSVITHALNHGMNIFLLFFFGTTKSVVMTKPFLA